MRSLRGVLDRSPLAGGQLLLAIDFLLGPVQEIAIVGDGASADMPRVLRAASTP